MDKRARTLGWLGLIGGGLISVAGNIRSLWIPAYTEVVDWHKLPEHTPQDPGAFVLAIVLPLAALVGVEMVNAWSHLHKGLRFGVLGLVSFAALASSFVHIVTVFMWYGQPIPLAILGAVAIDGIMILSGLALFTKPKMSDVQKDKDKDKDKDTDTDTADSGQPDTPDSADADTAPDTVPDMDTLPAAPVDIIPSPRRPRASAAWKLDAAEMIRNGDPDSDRGIAEKILADRPDTWTGADPIEAGRKAVSRLRASL